MTAQVLSLFPDVAPSMPDPPAIKLKKNPPKKEKYSDDFDVFWSLYPRKLNCSKLMAFRSWQKLDEEEHTLAMNVLPIFCAMMRGKEEQYIPHAVTWLNQKRFETIKPQRTVPCAPPAVDWTRALQIYRATGRWSADLGPEPDHKDYRGPS